MSLDLEKKQIVGIINRMSDNLAATASSQTGRDGALIRRFVGDLRANFWMYLSTGTFGAKLFNCFTIARTSNASLQSLAYVRDQLFLEQTTGPITIAIIQMGVNFCLATESRIITAIEFTSREDVDAMMSTMKIAFDRARDLAADLVDSSSYQALTFLAGSLTNHFAATSRPLPRMISFKLPVSMPALALSNRIYYTADRSEEICAENKVVHPAFCPRNIIGLSS